MSEKKVVERQEAGGAASPITIPKGMSIDEFKAKEAEKAAAAPPAQATAPTPPDTLVNKPAAPATPPTKPVETEGEISLAAMIAEDNGGNGGQGAPPAAAEKKLSIAKLKELEEDLEDDDQVVERFSSYKKKVKELEILAAGKDAIEADEQIKNFNTWKKASDETLFVAEEAAKFKKAGLSEEEAAAKAKARYDKLAKENPDAIEDRVLDIRSKLGEMIELRKKDLVKNLEETAKAYNFADILTGETVLKSVKESLSKTDNFLGMKISENKAEKEKLLSDAEQFVKSGDLKKELSNPDTVARVALFLKYGKQWEKAIQQRTNGKSKVLEKLPNVPPSGNSGTRVNPSAAKPQKKGEFNPSGWR